MNDQEDCFSSRTWWGTDTCMNICCYCHDMERFSIRGSIWACTVCYLSQKHAIEYLIFRLAITNWSWVWVYFFSTSRLSWKTRRAACIISVNTLPTKKATSPNEVRPKSLKTNRDGKGQTYYNDNATNSQGQVKVEHHRIMSRPGPPGCLNNLTKPCTFLTTTNGPTIIMQISHKNLGIVDCMDDYCVVLDPIWDFYLC